MSDFLQNYLDVAQLLCVDDRLLFRVLRGLVFLFGLSESGKLPLNLVVGPLKIAHEFLGEYFSASPLPEALLHLLGWYANQWHSLDFQQSFRSLATHQPS